MTTPLMFIYIFSLNCEELFNQEKAIRQHLSDYYGDYFKEHNITCFPIELNTETKTISSLSYKYLDFCNVHSHGAETIDFMQDMGNHLIELGLIKSYVLRNVLDLEEENGVERRRGVIVGKTNYVIMTLLVRFYQRFKYDYNLEKVIPILLDNTAKQPIEIVEEYNHQEFIEKFYEDPQFIEYRSDKKVERSWIEKLFSKMEDENI